MDIDYKDIKLVCGGFGKHLTFSQWNFFQLYNITHSSSK